MATSIYLDNNASTALLPAVRAAMVDALDRLYANPSSAHQLGLEAKRSVENARELFANFINAAYPAEISFTGGATEAIAVAFAQAQQVNPGAVAITAAEHAAVIDAAGRIAPKVMTIPVARSGAPDLEALEAALSAGASFVSIAWVNNETGVIVDVTAIAERCRRAGAILHIDAAQAAGRLPIDVKVLGCDYLTLSPHKFHGPKGVGVLYAKPKSSCAAGIARHQGTPNVVGIAGAAAAVRATEHWQDGVARIASLRNALEDGVLAAIPGSDINGAKSARVANTSNIYFPRRNAADLVEAFSRRNLYASAGAACSSGAEPSHVIRALGWDETRANASVRFSLSSLTTDDEIGIAVTRVRDAYQHTLSTEAR